MIRGGPMEKSMAVPGSRSPAIPFPPKTLTKWFLYKAVTLYNYQSRGPSQLSFTAGMELYVLKHLERGWDLAWLDGTPGVIPSKYAKEVTAETLSHSPAQTASLQVQTLPVSAVATDNVAETTSLSSFDKSLECSICLNPLKEPVEHPQCGNMFCKSCASNLPGGVCPLCREHLTTRPVVNKFVLNSVANILVPCPLCQKQVRQGDFIEHTSKCPVECPNHCGQRIPPDQLAEHFPVCTAVIVTCPAANVKCPWTGPRLHLSEHTASCHYLALESFLMKLLTENAALRAKLKEGEDAEDFPGWFAVPDEDSQSSEAPAPPGDADTPELQPPQQPGSDEDNGDCLIS
ncbi:hypothetical protein Pelo_17915 [Pelomyxa schiedti]|nr:hypothetical protein Pelo_17915 [Pelomyxa schiedti]